MNKSIALLASILWFALPGLAWADSYTYPVDFGDVPVGSASSPLDVLGNGTFSGAGCTVSLASSPITGPNAGDFKTSTCQPQSVAAGYCLMPVTFTPSSPGPKSASVSVTMSVSGCTGIADGTIYSFTFALSGTGTNGAPSATFDPLAGIPSTLPPVVQSVTPSGSASSLSLSTRMKFDASIAGQAGSIFVGARVPPYGTGSGLTGAMPQGLQEVLRPRDANGAWYISNGTTWGQLGPSIPPYFSGTLVDANGLVNILNGVNIAGLCGTEFYVGYGTSASAMLQNNTLGKVYTVMCNYDFTGTASGAASALNLKAFVQVATLDQGKAGNFYVGRLKDNQWSLYNGSAWVPYGGGAIPPYATAPLASRTIQIFNGDNVQALSGAQIYVGYGLSDADLLGNQKYKDIYDVQ